MTGEEETEIDSGQRGLGRRFAVLWAASWVSCLGDGMRFAVIPLLAVAAAASPAGVAFVAGAGVAPWLVFSLFGGVFADRINPARIMTLGHAARAVVMIGLAVWTGFDHPPVAALAAASFALGSGDALFKSAATKAVTGLVSDERLDDANGRIQVSYIVGSAIVGPVVGSLLFVVNAAIPLWVNAVSFTVGAILIATLGRVGQTPATHKSVVADMTEGFRHLWSNRAIRLLAVVSMSAAMGHTLATATLVVVITDDLHATPFVYGVVVAIGSAGGLLGAAIAGRLARRSDGRRRGITLVVATMGAAALLLGLSPSIWVTALAFAAFLFGVGWWNVLAVSMRQRLIPRDLLGRVNGIYLLLGRLGMLAGAAVSAGAGAWLGARAPIVAGGALFLLTLVAAPRFSAAHKAASREQTLERPRRVTM